MRLLLLLSLLLAGPVGAGDYRYSDCHVHIVDFFQRSEGLPRLLEVMDRNAIAHSMISGIGVMKKWAASAPRQPRYYLGDDAPVYWYSATDHLLAKQYSALPPAQRTRLHPFITGFNPTDRNAAAQIEQLLQLYPDTWQGIGEVFTRHDDLTALTLGETPRANHPAMDDVYALAARYDLPVMLHSNLTSQREADFIFLAELQQALEAHPETRFIWAHAGTSTTINRRQTLQGIPAMLDRLLARYDNLWIDLSWSLLTPYILDEAQVPRAAWVTLIERYPTRFMIGSDVVGKFGSMGRILSEFDRLLDALPPATAQRVAHDNFLDVLPQSRRDD